MYADVAIQRAPSAQDSLAGKPVLTRPGVVVHDGDPDIRTDDELIRNQLRCLKAVDESVGQILRALEATNQLNRTVVVFTSDHGYFWGEHGLGGKHGPYEEAIRVPLLIRYPPLIKPNSRFDQLVLNVDLAPTCLELAGQSIPVSIQGRSMVPILTGKDTRGRESVFTEYFYNQGQTPRFLTWQAVRSKHWKYIHYPDLEGADELYDLTVDPSEMTNRIAEPDSKSALVEMQGDLQQHLMELD